ncbi:MAG: crossover junction endodeoxyribonuclease RuvC [Pseudomonadota bacterium]|nr:crossover junction endodeoxyribonuclease RuvC [Pseudomonadota bacterium]
MIRVMGIDPGSRMTGYGVVAIEEGTPIYVASGCIQTTGPDFPTRLKDIFEGIEELIKQYRPDEFAIEEVFVARNPMSALKLGQARGAAITAAVTSDLVVNEYAARRIKQSVVGSGGATKGQVQHMVQALLNLQGIPSTDASDALAVAICHVNTRWQPKQGTP